MELQEKEDPQVTIFLLMNSECSAEWLYKDRVKEQIRWLNS